jgi:predicted TIM-barrel fold metal-dependent hydrolase
VLPTSTSTWPNTQDHLAKSFAGVAEDDKNKILWGNAAKLYRL